LGEQKAEIVNGLCAGSFPGAFDGVLEFQDRKIEFNRGSGAAVLELIVEKAGNKFATSLQQRFFYRPHF
jgi:hypothetical protein